MKKPPLDPDVADTAHARGAHFSDCDLLRPGRGHASIQASRERPCNGAGIVGRLWCRLPCVQERFWDSRSVLSVFNPLCLK
jgi:hypothetical protein